MEQQKPDGQNPQTQSQVHDFELLMEGLKGSVRKFQANPSPENFSHIVTALSEFGISGADIWHQAASYSRRHPIRVALFAGLVFFALKGLAPTTKDRQLAISAIH